MFTKLITSRVGHITLEKPFKMLILHSDPWHDAEDPPPFLQLHCSHKVKTSNLGECNDLHLAMHYWCSNWRRSGWWAPLVLLHWHVTCCMICMPNCEQGGPEANVFHKQQPQALLDVNIPVDWHYIKSDENRIQMLYCEQHAYQQGQKCSLNTNYFQHHQKWRLVRNPFVKCNNKNAKHTHTVKQKRDLHEKHHSQ